MADIMKTFNEQFQDNIDPADGTVVINETWYNRIVEEIKHLRQLPPLEGEFKDILGLMIFRTGPIGRRLNDIGLYKVSCKVEEEQAATLHWLINLYLANSANFHNEVERILTNEPATKA